MNLYPWIIKGYDVQKGIKYAIENSQNIGLLEYDKPLLSSIIDVSDSPLWLKESFTDEIWNAIADLNCLYIRAKRHSLNIFNDDIKEHIKDH